MNHNQTTAIPHTDANWTTNAHIRPILSSSARQIGKTEKEAPTFPKATCCKCGRRAVIMTQTATGAQYHHCFQCYFDGRNTDSHGREPVLEKELRKEKEKQ